MTQARVGNPGTNTGNTIRDSALGLASQTVDAIVALNNSVWRKNSVRSALLEMLRLRNARTVNCVFCKSVRYDVAKQDGLTEDKVARIDDDFQSSDLTEIEKTALAFADVYLRTPDQLDAQLIAKLREFFTEEQICHMAVSLTTFNATSRCAVSLGGMPESLPIMEMQLPPEEQTGASAH